VNGKECVLVVDDELRARQNLSRSLTSRGYKVECLGSGAEVMPRLRAPKPPSVILLDLMMPQVCGLDILAEMLKLERPIPAIVVSAVGQVSTVVQGMRMGARNYLVKPFEDEQLHQAIRNVLDETLPHTKSEVELIWSNEKLRRIQEVTLQVADTDLPILILGESGVGKDVAARFIHSNSVRRHEPFVNVNCAALPGELLESEFFGYDTGAFTGALRDKPGKFELAGKGTLVLDEIGEMSPHLQAKLLHVLQDGEYSRLGGVRPLQLRARVLALTNRNLEDAVARGEFRRDLYFRLNVIRIELPPLRDRKEDIPKLCNTFILKYSREYNRPPRELSSELLDAFSRYSWPGNIRQLENMMKRYVVIPDSSALLAEVTESDVRPKLSAQSHQSLKNFSAEAAETAEKELIFRTLEQVQWNRKLAAKRLDICYKSLLNKLKRWETVKQ
jgi:two-component system response regulator AtoC